jgi:hypothetical protein
VATILGAATCRPVAIISGLRRAAPGVLHPIVICPVHVRACWSTGESFSFLSNWYVGILVQIVDYFVRTFLLLTGGIGCNL